MDRQARRFGSSSGRGTDRSTLRKRKRFFAPDWQIAHARKVERRHCRGGLCYQPPVSWILAKIFSACSAFFAAHARDRGFHRRDAEKILVLHWRHSNSGRSRVTGRNRGGLQRRQSTQRERDCSTELSDCGYAASLLICCNVICWEARRAEMISRPRWVTTYRWVWGTLWIRW